MNSKQVFYYAINLPTDYLGQHWYITHSIYSRNCCQTSLRKLPHTVFDTKEAAQKELNSFREWCPKYCAGAKIVMIQIDFDI